MAEPLTVRFIENERYDIETDLDMVMFIAVTGRGSWSAQTPVGPQLRERRKQFRTDVVDLMYQGIEPCELEFD